MHRFYLANPTTDGKTARLTGEEWRHCRTVLRLKKGDRLTIFDGKGTEYLTQIHEAAPQAAALIILQKTSAPRPPYHITLAQALTKHRSMDLVFQKATELGVQRIIPVRSDRSVIEIADSQAETRYRRWRQIVVESAKQCGLDWLPEITPIHTVQQVVAMAASYCWPLIGSLQGDARPLWEHLTKPRSPSDEALLMIGPEGDFTPAEMALARGAGFLPLSLGPLVLRCETATICAVSTLCYELRRLQERAAK